MTWRAVLLRGDARMPCAIVDISLGGAKLVLANGIASQTYVILLSEKFGSLEGHVAWQDGRHTGIAFSDPATGSRLRPYLIARAGEMTTATVNFGRRRPR